MFLYLGQFLTFSTCLTLDMLLDVTSQYIPAAFGLEGTHSRGAAEEPS